MVAVLLVTHGDLAKSLLSSATLIMGETSLIETHGLYHGDNVDDLKEVIKEAVLRLYELSAGDGVLILTDLFGGSPSNAIARALYELGDRVKAECITGVNLPILLEASSSKAYMTMDEMMAHLPEVGKASIVDLKKQIQFQE